MNVRNIVDSVPGAVENSGDYMKDGLLHCGTCHEPKEMKTEFPWGGQTVRVMCRCETAEFATREKEAKTQKKAAYIEWLRDCGIPHSLHEYRFERVEDALQGVSQSIKKYVDKWDEMKQENAGLLFWGGVGNGKTYIAACVANALIDREVPCVITSFGKILSLPIGERDEQIESLRWNDLLILDDLGAERDNPYALEIVYRVINDRYTDQKPLLATTNLTLDELRHAGDLKYQRIYDRVLEMCIPIHFKGESLRSGIAKTKLDRAKELLR